MINPNDPAMPSTTKELHETELNMGEYYVYKSYPGLSIREEFAARMMQTLVARNSIPNMGMDDDKMAKRALELADALIYKINKE